MHRYPRWPIHVILVGVSFLMLIPFYWVLKTSVTGENIFAYPPSVLPKAPHPFYSLNNVRSSRAASTSRSQCERPLG